MASGDTHKSNRPTHQYERHKIEELEERLHNMTTIATVVSVDKESMTVQATCYGGDLEVKAFVMAHGSADYSQWIPPVIGDKVLLISDNGDFNDSYAFPIRLPANYSSNIADGMEIAAGNFTIRYDKDEDEYIIVNGDKEISIKDDEVCLKHSNTEVVLDANTITLKNGLNEVKLRTGSTQVTSGASTMAISPGNFQVSVPGGTLDIVGGSFTFNGQQVVRV